MATDAQIQANRLNAQLSTGPTTEAGREAVSQNRTTHGLSGLFKAQNEREIEQYATVLRKICDDFNTTTGYEIEVAGKMAEAMVRSNRAVLYQDLCTETLEFGDEDEFDRAHKLLQLYIRYQGQHDRAYQRYAAELRKFQSEKKKAEIGFESQKRREAQDVIANAQENRKQEYHQATLSLVQARLEHQILKNRSLSRVVPTTKKEEIPPIAA